MNKPIITKKTIDKEVSHVFSDAVHDIKNPLSSIKILLQLLRKQVSRTKDAKSELFIDRIEDQTAVILSDLNQLNDFSKIISANLILNLEFFELKDVLDEITGKHDIKITNFQEKEMMGDKRRVLQALEYIILFLIHQSLAQPLVMDIVYNKTSAEITIQSSLDNDFDTEHIFHWEKLANHGFLLPIAKSIIEKHGGKVKVALNRGFICTIPFRAKNL